MNFSSRVAVAAIAAGIFLVPALAIAQTPKAGGDAGDMWETTVKMEMPGMPMAMPATTHRMCLAKQANDDQFVPKRDNCKVTESQRSGNTQRFKMVCTGKDAMTADGEITHAGASYNGRMRMRMQSENLEMTQTFSGKKVGECTGVVRN